MAYRRGELPPLQPKQLMLGVHSLSNVDLDARVADCAVCGPQVPIRVRERKNKGGLTCDIKERERKRRDSRSWRLRERYGITPEDYGRMLAEQKGKCAICHTEQPGLVVDHDHETGAVRGLLCFGCNVALGWLRDREDSAIQAARYLRTHRSA